jgi:L-ascorbate metabolism protein UlaG (beta-lactamase superfamily)
MRSLFIATVLLLFLGCISLAFFSPDFEEDSIPTSQGDLKITCIGHGTLMFTFDEKIVHVDPVFRYADYRKMPKADLVLVTHEHGDHLDDVAIQDLTKEGTAVICTSKCLERLKIKDSIVMKNGDIKTIHGITVEAIPAYNIKHMRSENSPFHPKGEGNGYILNFADKRVYVAGDTENTPEMKALENIDVAFLPMNLPYTMTPEMVADAAKAFKPKVLYPYHFGSTDTSQLVELLKDTPEIEVRIRNLK